MMTPSRSSRHAAGTPSRARRTPSGGQTPRKPLEMPGEEGIQVAIRMRPLNKTTEAHTSRRVWKVLQKYSSIAQTTAEGKPLPERVAGRNFFTFDQTFGETASTEQVYDAVAKGIVSSVVTTGKNGTIFAYGQTSSGKTYTMQGSGTIEEKGSGGGVVHMATRDIFSHIENNPDRVFCVRASFLEIYNEEVRDLLKNDNKTLSIREDPRRGVFVQSHEEIVTDFESLLNVLFRGEKSRAFASTAMNERSSRSHTIFRITVESRKKSETPSPEGEDMNDENENLDGAVLVSTLNLVDLAGSESVRHTGATGDRQKEGGMINQSLLTLSRVIVALGTPNQTHINFRDSKLTRILQPALSGNARMAVVCCATPSELYLEETRSTLQFASRAKLVKTHAQVNEVLDDRSIIRRLQKEIAEMRKYGGGGDPSSQVKALENQAEEAGTAARVAEDRLKRLQSSILNGDFFNGEILSANILKSNDNPKKRRRLSDGQLLTLPQSPVANFVLRNPKSETRPSKHQKKQTFRGSDAAVELSLFKEALKVKTNVVAACQKRIGEVLRTLQTKESDLLAVKCAQDILREERDQNRAESVSLSATIKSVRTDLSTCEESLREKEKLFSQATKKLETQLNDRAMLEATIDKLQGDNLTLEQAVKSSKDELIQSRDEWSSSKELLTAKVGALEKQATEQNQEISKIQIALSDRQAELDCKSRGLDEKTAEVATLTTNLSATQAYLNKINMELTGQKEELSQTRSKLEDNQKELADQQEAVSRLFVDKSLIESQLDTAVHDKTTVSTSLLTAHEELVSLKLSFATVTEELHVSNHSMLELSKVNCELKEQLCTNKSQSDNEKKELKEQMKVMDEQILAAEVACHELEARAGEQQNVISSNQDHLTKLENSLLQKEEEVSRLQEDLKSTKGACTELDTLRQLYTDVEKERNEAANMADALSQKVSELESTLARTEESTKETREELDTLKQLYTVAEKERNEATNKAHVLSQKVNELESMLEKTEESTKETREELDTLKQSYTDVDKERNEATNEADALSQKVNELESTLARTEESTKETSEQLDTLKQLYTDVEKERNEATNNAHVLSQKVNELETTLEKNCSEHSENGVALEAKTEEIAKLRQEMATKEELRRSEIQQLEAKIEKANAQATHAANMELQKVSLQGQVAALNEQIDEASSKIVLLEKDVDESSRRAEDAIKSLQERESENMNTHDLLESANSKILTLQRKLVDIEDNFASKEQMLGQSVTSLERQRDELKTCLDEAKSCTSSEQDDLQSQLVDLKRIMEESEMESSRLQEQLESTKSDLKEAQAKLLRLENDDKASSPLVSRLEKKNEQLQAQLDGIRAAREEEILELKQLMGEEQREIIREAETNMKGLHDKIEELQVDLTRIEAEAYASRQQKHDVEDEITLQLAVVKSHESTINALNEHISKNQRELAEAVSAAEIVEKKHRDLLDRVRCLENDKTSLKDQLNTLDLSQARQIEDARRDISTEKRRLHQSLSQSEHTVVQLSQKLKRRDERIKKLESQRMTREQAESIKKMRAEKDQYKKDLARREAQLIDLQSQLDTSKLTSTMEPSEMSQMRFDNDALHQKLRRLGAHNQQLEDERKRMLQAVRSTKGVHMPDQDLQRAIVQLCDRLTSLQNSADDQRRVPSYHEELKEIKVSHEILAQKNRSLEKENLRLMKDLKTQREQQKRTNAEMFKLSVQDEQDTTAEIGAIRSKLATLGRKESRDLVTRETPNSSALRKRKISVLNSDKDKENTANKMVMQSTANLPSASKSRRRVPGLGEASQSSEDNTQECNQT